MAKLIGPLQLSGSIGDLTFAKTKFGIVVKAKSSLNKEKFYAYESMEGSRKTSKEFGHASLMSVKVRRALKPVAAQANDKTVHFRLNKVMGEVLRTDTDSDKGSRNIGNGDLHLLNGFEWHKKYTLHGTLKANYIANLNRETGTMRMVVPGFRSAQMLKKPKGATHYQIVAGGVAFGVEDADDNGVGWSANHARSKVLEISHNKSEELCLDLSVKVKSGDVMVMGLGVVFYQRSGDGYLSMKEKTCFALVKTGICDKPEVIAVKEESKELPVNERERVIGANVGVKKSKEVVDILTLRKSTVAVKSLNILKMKGDLQLKRMERRRFMDDFLV